MPFTEPSAWGDFFFAFLSILLEGAPYIFLGTLISGFIDAYLPSNTMDRLLPRNRPLAICVSGLLGAVFPVCECAIVPVIRRLVKKGLPVSCAITYMLSAPIINPIVVISTLSAFKAQEPVFMAVSRILIAYMVTVGVGLIVQQFSAKSILKRNVYDTIASGPDHGADHDHDHKTGKPNRLIAAMRTAQRDFLDVAMYFSIGVMITAVFNTRVPKDFIQDIAGNDFITVPGMMALAFILSLCSTSDAFIAATLASVSQGAKLAFLIFGPMIDVKLLFMYSAVFRGRFIVYLTTGLFLIIGIICIFWTNVAGAG